MRERSNEKRTALPQEHGEIGLCQRLYLRLRTGAVAHALLRQNALGGDGVAQRQVERQAAQHALHLLHQRQEVAVYTSHAPRAPAGLLQRRVVRKRGQLYRSGTASDAH